MPHVFFSRIDHRRRRYDACECQACTPTPVAMDGYVNPLTSNQVQALIGISDAADKALRVLRQRAMRGSTARPTVGEANLTLETLELIFDTVQELLA